LIVFNINFIISIFLFYTFSFFYFREHFIILGYYKMSRKKTTFADEHHNPLEDVSYHRDLHYTDIRERAARALKTLNNYNWFLFSGKLIRANKEDIVDKKFINNERTTVLRPSDGIAREMLRKGKSWIPMTKKMPTKKKKKKNRIYKNEDFEGVDWGEVGAPRMKEDVNKMRRRLYPNGHPDTTLPETAPTVNEQEAWRRSIRAPGVRHMGRNTTNPLESHTAGATVGKIAGRVCKIMADGVKRCFNNPPNLVGIGSKFRGGKRTRRKKDKRKKRKTRRRRKGRKITRKIKKHNRGKKFKKSRKNKR